MKKLLAFTSITLLLFFIQVSDEPLSAPVTNRPLAAARVGLHTQRPKPSLGGISRTIAQTPSLKTKKPRPTFQTAPEIRVGKGYVFAKDIGAVAKAEYDAGLGIEVSSDDTFVYFRKMTEESSIPVAFSTSKSKFYPISRILHIEGVSQELRTQLLSEGLQEYHYMRNLKLLFVEATSEDVMKTYEQLIAKGLKVELEVLKELPRSR